MAPRPGKDEQRRRIVLSAFEVLANEGLQAFAMRRVAQQAGCTIGLINHWFSSKEDLIMAAWKEAGERETARTAALLVSGEHDVLGVLEASLPIDEARRQEALVWVAFHALAVSQPSVRTATLRRYALARRVIGDLLAAGSPRSARDEQAADAMLAAMEGITIMAARDPVRWPARRQRLALRTLLEPLLAAHRS